MFQALEITEMSKSWPSRTYYQERGRQINEVLQHMLSAKVETAHKEGVRDESPKRKGSV